ncbi:MAG TPA: oxygen-independent coproporphyrinogen III oxidase [Eubacteriaceae bacterium]|nr:oxygen-independent coproporphyrinogen III oxidase [Eubacteriaceae bacterium]
MNNYCGLYIHIPFCAKKCYYCDFPSYSNLEEMITPYIIALKKEIQLIAIKYPDIIVKTIFIGGGTPTYIDSKYIIEIMETIRNNFTIINNAEISLEGNPGTYDFFKLSDYKEGGINRLSIGVQTTQDRLLNDLGRIHTKRQFLQAFNNAREIGFNNINIDLIFGLPNQSMEDWQETLEEVVRLQPTHLSCYSLIIEEGTPFYELYRKGRININEDLEREMYYYTKKFLTSQGYNHYEISNFAKEGFQCIHNLIYWDVKPYIGIGSSAHSFLNNNRFSNYNSVEKYIESLANNQLPISSVNKLSKEDLIEEYIFLGLRKIQGISARDFFNTYGEKIESRYGKTLDKLVRENLIKKGENIALTSKGLDFANYVFQSFL